MATKSSRKKASSTRSKRTKHKGKITKSKKRVAGKAKSKTTKKKSARKPTKTTKRKSKRLTKAQKNQLILRNKIINEKLSAFLDETGFTLLKILLEKRKISEFKLASLMNLKVNKVRSILYKLQTRGIVSFSRRRDKRKGWYIFTWEINPKNIIKYVINELNSDIKVLEKKYHLKQEGKEFFSCNECGVQMSMLKAMETNYLCPYCGTPMQVIDVERIKRDILNEINAIKKKIESLKELEKVI